MVLPVVGTIIVHLVFVLVIRLVVVGRLHSSINPSVQNKIELYASDFVWILTGLFLDVHRMS